MQIVVRNGEREREVVVDQRAPDAVVADLLAELGVAADGIDVDGRYVDGREGLAEAPIPDGAVVTPARLHGPLARTPPPAADRWVTVVAGAGTGTRVPLLTGSTVIGRGQDCHVRLDSPTVSDRHALLHVDGSRGVTVEDAGSSNGTWVDGRAVRRPTALREGSTVRLGAVVLRLDGPDPADVPAGIDRHLAPGNIPFNRPPRPALPTPPAPIAAPGHPDDDRSSQPLRVAAMLAPLLMAGGMIWMTGNPRFAMFALLSPVMVVGNWISSRRQAARSNREASSTYRRAVTDFRADMERAQQAEHERREATCIDLGEILRRAEGPSVRLWERRPHHEDVMRLRLGSADVPWDPPVTTPDDQPTEEVAEVLRANAHLPAAPVEVDLRPGEVVGIVGDREAGLALARSLVLQATVLHGPADLQLGVFTRDDTSLAPSLDSWLAPSLDSWLAPSLDTSLAPSLDGAGAWHWTTWLPHTHDASGRARMLSADHATSERMLGSVLDAWRAEHEGTRHGAAGPDLSVGGAREAPTGPIALYVIDDVDLLTGRRAPARDLLAGAGGPTSGIVLAPTEDQLPASCSVVVDVRSDLADASVRWPALARRQDEVILATLERARARARQAARAMAHHEDPELTLAGGMVPTMARLLPLLELDSHGRDDGNAITADAVLAAWSRGLPDPPPATPIGLGEDGPVHLDLVTDGPHGLVGGTTGSGKSELLRSLVAGMAARVDPDHLVFVLVDYKGGSAFDQCARLPHTVGMVTDLDEHLGERALTSLQAELHHRERVLRDAGAADLPEYLEVGAPKGPLPRMVVVIDEFATLAADLPDFLDALVGIAQRGRSLGVHLLLATQRPKGAVNANIRANTNLRIALRVQDGGDSTDIIDAPDAAELDRSTPGRAYVRRGHGDTTLVQTALATAPTGAVTGAAVALGDLRFAPTSAPPPPVVDDGGPTDLSLLVDACREAFRQAGMDEPRRPWLPMLAEDLSLDEVLAEADGRDEHAPDRGGGDHTLVPFAMADDPAAQGRRPLSWRPADGHLAVFGMVGSGTSTALQAVGRSLTERLGPDACHLYGLDFGGGALQAFASLPHTGAIVSANEREAQFRLVRMLRAEVERRRELSARDRRDEPLVVVLLDGVAVFLGEHDGVESQELMDGFRRVFQEGPQVGVVFAVTGERPAVLPMRLGALVNQKVLLRHADPNDFGTIGLRSKALPTFVPGRGIDAATSRVVQVGLPGDLAQHAARAASVADASDGPLPVRALPTSVAFADVAERATAGPPVRVPVGIGDADLAPASLDLHAGDHVTVAGPARSGRSTVLQLLSSQLRIALPDAIQIAVCDAARSPLHGWPSLDAAGSLAGLTAALGAGPTHDRPWFVFVDDVIALADPDGVLEDLVTARPDLHLVVAGRTADLRASYGHWTKRVRQSRTGLLLEPDLATDGDVFSVRLPRRVPVPFTTGRGFLVRAGETEIVQCALPPDRPPRGSIGEP